MEGEWRADVDGEGHITGRFRMQLRNPEEAEAIHRAVHDVPIWVGHGYVVARISNIFLPNFQESSKNGRRGPQ